MGHTLDCTGPSYQWVGNFRQNLQPEPDCCTAVGLDAQGNQKYYDFCTIGGELSPRDDFVRCGADNNYSWQFKCGDEVDGLLRE